MVGGQEDWFVSCQLATDELVDNPAWVAFYLASPDFDVRERFMNLAGEFFDGEAFGREVPGDNECDWGRFGFKLAMETGFASDQRVATGGQGITKEFAASSA